MSIPNSEARNKMTDLERQIYDWGFQEGIESELQNHADGWNLAHNLFRRELDSLIADLTLDAARLVEKNDLDLARIKSSTALAAIKLRKRLGLDPTPEDKVTQ